jgi:hypothetical protein
LADSKAGSRAMRKLYNEKHREAFGAAAGKGKLEVS